MSNSEDLQILSHFLSILNELGIQYAVGGSIASSIYGQVRFTQDADVAVIPFDNKSEQFYKAVKEDYYISKDAMRQALSNRTGFNVIHLKTAFKMDVFVCKDTEYEKHYFSRRHFLKLSDSIETPVAVVSAEDIILLKLQWYKTAGCVSDKQWSDILGVLSVQKENLKYDYLENWSKKLGIEDVYQKALRDVML